MCRRIECPQCGRPSFVGCGAHVEQVLGDVPRAERCRCREKKAEAQAATDQGARPSWFRKIFGE